MITLKTLRQATAQQVFDQAKEHLLKQNCRSLTETKRSTYICSYRGANGTKCAGGCFIGDDEYSEDMEGESWDQLVLLGTVPFEHSFLIANLQDVHDLYVTDEWPDRLKELAQRHELKF